jgi:hypothetical protein
MFRISKLYQIEKKTLILNDITHRYNSNLEVCIQITVNILVILKQEGKQEFRGTDFRSRLLGVTRLVCLKSTFTFKYLN